MAEEKQKGGRPSKYETHVLPNLELVEAWARDGATEADIAKRLHISQDTLIEYKKHFPEFSEVLKRGRAVVDTQVENALLKRALGYDYDEVTEEYVGGEMRVAKVIHKQVMPDVGAQAFWLKNRKPDIWKERQEVGLTAGAEELKDAYDQAAAAIKKQGG